jgi:SAM-dependent methyltransferase
VLSKINKLAREFSQSADKGEWLRNEVKWRYFTYRQRAHHRQNVQFDAEHHVETAGDLALEKAGISGDQIRAGNGVYRALTGALFHSALAAIPLPHEQYSFVDVGSGKGKVLLMAADYPFRRVVGIEYSPLLHQVAVKNIASYVSSTQRCRDVVAELGDALAYVPPPGPLFFFMFNALAPDMMERWLAGVDRLAGEDSDRAIVVEYTNLRTVREMAPVLERRVNLETFRRSGKFVVLANSAARRTLASAGGHAR